MSFVPLRMRYWDHILVFSSGMRPTVTLLGCGIEFYFPPIL